MSALKYPLYAIAGLLDKSSRFCRQEKERRRRQEEEERKAQQLELQRREQEMEAEVRQMPQAIDNAFGNFLVRTPFNAHLTGRNFQSLLSNSPILE